MKMDLANMNEHGHFWIIKTGGMASVVDMFRGDNVTEIGLVRENLTDTVYSHLVADLLSHYHYTKRLPENREQELFDKYDENPDAIISRIEAAITGAIAINYNVLLLWYAGGKNFPIYTYENLIKNEHNLFKDVSETTTFTSEGFVENPVPRLKTPSFPDFKKEITPLIREKLYPDILNSINTLSDIKFCI